MSSVICSYNLLTKYDKFIDDKTNFKLELEFNYDSYLGFIRIRKNQSDPINSLFIEFVKGTRVSSKRTIINSICSGINFRFVQDIVKYNPSKDILTVLRNQTLGSFIRYDPDFSENIINFTEKFHSIMTLDSL